MGYWRGLGLYKLGDWDYTNWVSGEPDNAHGGQDYLCFNFGKTNGALWDDTGKQADGSVDALPYICEWDYILTQDTVTTVNEAGGVALSVDNDGNIKLAYPSLEICSSSTSLQLNTWYHVLLRISGETVSVFVDGIKVMTVSINSFATIYPETVQLGGYVGYMDEFAFRRNAGTDAPTVPTVAYETGTTETVQVKRDGNAPVSRVAWGYENLPDGLTLSSAGVLSGKPTTAGTYECDVSVATNWGTTTKTIKITVV